MVKLAIFLLVFAFEVSSHAADVCIVNSYSIPPARRVETRVQEILKKHGHRIVNRNCRVKILIGTPAIVEELKKSSAYKKVYSFVLFPEKFGLEKEKNFYGVRVFPLPEKTYKRLIRKLYLEKKKVAVPISDSMISIAKIYLPEDTFSIIPFNNSPMEIFGSLLKYKYVYIFPDPKILKLVNITNLVNFCKDNNLIIFSGLGDLSKFDLDYVDKIDYEKLAEELVFLVENDSGKRILPCPCKEE